MLVESDMVPPGGASHTIQHEPSLSFVPWWSTVTEKGEPRRSLTLWCEKEEKAEESV